MRRKVPFQAIKYNQSGKQIVRKCPGRPLCKLVETVKSARQTEMTQRIWTKIQSRLCRVNHSSSHTYTQKTVKTSHRAVSKFGIALASKIKTLQWFGLSRSFYVDTTVALSRQCEPGLKWLETVSSLFQDVVFAVSLSPLYID